MFIKYLMKVWFCKLLIPEDYTGNSQAVIIHVTTIVPVNTFLQE